MPAVVVGRLDAPVYQADSPIAGREKADLAHFTRPAEIFTYCLRNEAINNIDTTAIFTAHFATYVLTKKQTSHITQGLQKFSLAVYGMKLSIT